MRAWNWSWYCLRLHHYRPCRLRLRMYCARGWEAALARSLREDARAEGLTFSCRATAKGRLDVRRAPSLVQALRRMGPSPALAAALEEYESATGLCYRGIPVDPALRERLTRACRRVMVLFPHPPGLQRDLSL